MFLSFFSSSWCRGLAVVCDSGIPWTFLLTFSKPWTYLSPDPSLFPWFSRIGIAGEVYQIMLNVHGRLICLSFRVNVCSSEHPTLSFVYQFMNLRYGLGTLTTDFYSSLNIDSATLLRKAQLPRYLSSILFCSCFVILKGFLVVGDRDKLSQHNPYYWLNCHWASCFSIIKCLSTINRGWSTFTAFGRSDSVNFIEQSVFCWPDLTYWLDVPT